MQRIFKGNSNKKRKIKLSTKLILYYFTASLFFLMITGFLINSNIKRYGIKSVEEQLINQTDSSLDYIKQTLYLKARPGDDISVETAQKIAKELSAGNREIRLYDKKFNLLCSYTDGIKQSPYRTEILKTHLKQTLGENYAYISNGKSVFFAAPVKINNKIVGIFETVYPLDLLNRILSQTTTVLITAGVIFVIFIILLSIYLAKITVRPINKLIFVAEKYSRQDFVPINLKGPLEIQKLSNSIGEMGQKIQDYINRQNEFVSNVSHELKTPLTAIKGYSEFLTDEVKKGGFTEKAVYHLNRETERLTKMVNELLTLSRMDTGDNTYAMEIFNLSELVLDVLNLTKMRDNTKEIKIYDDIDENICIIGDRRKLFQVILNVIDNAIKYSSDEIKISVKKNKVAVLKVKDNGIGIDIKDRDKIFDRFYRAENAKSYKGSGLGLAIAKEIVSAHNGDIKIDSEKGEGTVVKITLPVSQMS